MPKYTEAELGKLMEEVKSMGLDMFMFIFELDRLWEWLGYSKKSNAVAGFKLVELEEGVLA